MRWQFWILLVMSFLLINGTFAGWIAAVQHGGLAIGPGFEKATYYTTLESLLFAAGFRFIPYSIIIIVAIFSSLRLSAHGRMALWIALLAVSVFHSWGYYMYQASSYTTEHLSSTAALMVLFIPLHAVWIGALFGWVCYRIMKARTRSKGE